jgi:hypothetical protein
MSKYTPSTTVICMIIIILKEKKALQLQVDLQYDWGRAQWNFMTQWLRFPWHLPLVHCYLSYSPHEIFSMEWGIKIIVNFQNVLQNLPVPSYNRHLGDCTPSQKSFCRVEMKDHIHHSTFTTPHSPLHIHWLELWTGHLIFLFAWKQR